MDGYFDPDWSPFSEKQVRVVIAYVFCHVVGPPVPGAQPEVQPLDNSLNKDVDDSFRRHETSTCALDESDPLKFSNTSKGSLVSAYNRIFPPAFSCASGSLQEEQTFVGGVGCGSPSSTRICQDVDRAVESLRRIFDANGVKIPDTVQGTGHRHTPGVSKWGGKRIRKSVAPSNWIHRDAHAAQVQRSVGLYNKHANNV